MKIVKTILLSCMLMLLLNSSPVSAFNLDESGSNCEYLTSRTIKLSGYDISFCSIALYGAPPKHVGIIKHTLIDLPGDFAVCLSTTFSLLSGWTFSLKEDFISLDGAIVESTEGEYTISSTHIELDADSVFAKTLPNFRRKLSSTTKQKNTNCICQSGSTLAII
ncbi:MAG: hypothetical protein AB8F78_19710 [Saprospiraceae bacterium]